MFGQILGTATLIFLLAFMVETLVEAVFGKLFANIPVLKPYSWTLFYIAVAAGVGGAFVYQFDFVYLLSQFVEAPVAQTPYGIAITGVSIGMGATYVHDLIQKFFVKKPAPSEQG